MPTVAVNGVLPGAGTVPHIVGQALSGQKVVGYITLGFGTPTIVPGGTARSATGLGSAGQFGTVTTKQVTYRTPPGLGSAQQFGTPTTVITRVPQSVAIPGKTSAQQFGAVTIKATITVPVQGVPTAQNFGLGVHLKYNQFVPVKGIGPGVVFHICGMYLCGQAFVGWDSISGLSQFGKPKVGIWGVHPPQPIDIIIYPTTPVTIVLEPSEEEELDEWIIRPTTEVPM